jgi:hypothetical protein
MQYADGMSATQAAKADALTLDELRIHRDEILRLAASHGARNVRVFGSVARGEARPDSDVDLAVVLDPGRDVLDLCALIADLENLLGRSVDLVDMGKRPDHALAARSAALIEREAVAL